jgi:hypothetical protein
MRPERGPSTAGDNAPFVVTCFFIFLGTLQFKARRNGAGPPATDYKINPKKLIDICGRGDKSLAQLQRQLLLFPPKERAV